MALQELVAFARERLTSMPGWAAYQECVAREGADACTHEYDQALWQLLPWEMNGALAADRFRLTQLVRLRPEEASAVWAASYSAATSVVDQVALLAARQATGLREFDLDENAVEDAVGSASIVVSTLALDAEAEANRAPSVQLGEVLRSRALDAHADSRVRERSVLALARAERADDLADLAAHVESDDNRALAAPLGRALGGCAAACYETDLRLLDSASEDTRMIGINAALANQDTLTPALRSRIAQIASGGEPAERERAERVLGQ